MHARPHVAADTGCTAAAGVADDVAGGARIEANLAAFEQVVSHARAHLDAGRGEHAAVHAQIAGFLAWLNHTGRFASAEMEDLVRRLAERIPAAPSTGAGDRTLRDGAPREVVHIATQLYATGGHTQMIARWLDQDTGPRHRVVVTHQGSAPLPDKILGRIAGPGDLLLLDRRRGGLMRRAGALREAVRGADVVVLHTHPHDVVPSIALAGQGHRVVMVNHADHVFWIGAGVTTVLLNLRESGRALAIDRRGIDPARCVVAARPLDAVPRTLTREEAKQQLGVDPDQVLVVTAADGSKYESCAGPSLLDLVVPVLRDRERAVLLAAGPRPEGQWLVAGELTGGRIQALGQLPDVSLLHQAADVYLDSYPFSSLTSLLESGSCGNALLTYRGHPAECLVLGADTPGLEGILRHPRDPQSFREELVRLLDDVDYRRRLGEASRDAIAATHQGEGWRESVRAVYREAATRDTAAVTLGPAPWAAGLLDRLVERVQAQTPFAQGLPYAIRMNLALLPTAPRLAIWLREAVRREPPAVRLLLPEWLSQRLASLVRTWRGKGAIGSGQT